MSNVIKEKRGGEGDEKIYIAFQHHQKAMRRGVNFLCVCSCTPEESHCELNKNREWLLEIYFG